VQILTWAGLTPVFCDVDPETQMLTADRAEKLITSKTSAVLGVHLWGRGCDPNNLAELCRRRNLKLIFDSAHAIGCTFGGRNMGGFGDVEIFSFHATKVLGATEGGALTTNDDDLAGQIRTVRNFHSSQTYGEVPVRINGKMTEAQAGFALLGLVHLDEWIERNRKLYQRHKERAGAAPGVRFVDHAQGERSNYQYCVVAIDPQLDVTRDEIRQILEAENIWARRYFYPGMHRTAPYGAPGGKSNVNLPVTDMLCTQLLQLPLGSGMTNDDVDRIWDIVELCTKHPEEIRKRLDSRSQ
ncbi:MAG: DegT/DnrJ/EryC1/StrS family aminotransferase, partial [Pseudolabrys sp.]